MKPPLLLIFFLYWTAHCCGQYFPPDEKRYTDSLGTAFISAGSDSLKVMPGFLLSEFWSTKDTVKASHFFSKSLEYAGKYPLLSAIGGYYQAVLFMRNDPDSAGVLFLKTDTILERFKNRVACLYQAKCRGSYAIIQKKKDHHKTYIDILLNRAIPKALQAADSIYLGILYLDVGIGFKNMLDYASAGKNLEMAIDILKSAKAPPEYLIPVYHTIAENAILSGKNNVAGNYLDTMKLLLRPYPDFAGWLDYYAAEGMYLTVAQKFDEAIAYINQGVGLAKRIKQSYPEQRLLLQKFYALYNKKAFRQAKEVMIALMKREEIMAIMTNRVQMYYGLALTYAHLKDMSNAYAWMERYSALSDSINQSNTLKNMNELEAKFHTSEKEKKILALQSEKDKAALHAQQQRSANRLLMAVCFFLLVLAVASWCYYKKISRQKEINHRQALKDIGQQQQLKLTQALLDGEERERKRVARDLHDGLGGMLAGVKLNLSGMEDTHQEFAQDNELNRVIGQLDNSIIELRRIARNMMPDTLLKLGLEMALKDLCEAYNTPKMEVSFQAMNIATDIPLSNQTNIYRIIQELISNAVKHAHAGRILVQCSQNGPLFLITIEDNGTGFDTAVLDTKKGLGWSNIKNRVAFLKGKLEIHSQASEGTTINIELNSYAG